MFAAASKKTSIKSKMTGSKKKSPAATTAAETSEKQHPNKMAMVAKKTTLKAKTLIDAMQTLNLIPSFSTSNFGGDILPENVLIKNILESMIANTTTLALISENIDHLDIKTLNPYIASLQRAIKNVEASEPILQNVVKVEDYDADTEAKDSKGAKKLKRREKVFATSESHSIDQQETTVSTEAKKVVRAARDILLVIENDPRQANFLSQALSLKNVEKANVSNFLNCLTEMVEYSKNSVTLPYETHMTEIDSLCGSIFMSQKLKKSIRKIQGTLNEVKDNHEKLREEKRKEKEELVQTIKQVRAVTNSHINKMHEEVDNKIKTMAWNSHARQTRALEACSKLKREFDENLSDHGTSETDLRHENIKLETEISGMIAEFDEAMFTKHHAIDKISAEYAVEKVELQDAKKALADIEIEREAIIKKQQRLEEEERNAKLLVIRQNVAAKVIQRAYRSYKARMLLKKKKKKKKAAS